MRTASGVAASPPSSVAKKARACGVSSMPSPPISKPLAFGSTRPPSACAMTWCPKQTPSSLSLFATASRVQASSSAIQGSASYAPWRLPEST